MSPNEENLQFLDELDLKIVPSPTKSPPRSRQDLFRTIFTFIFNSVRRRKVYCIGRGYTCAKRYLQQRGWINVGKGVTNSKVCIRRIDHKLVTHHNLALLRENAKAVLRSHVEFLRDKRNLYLALISGFIPNHIWIAHRADIRWNYLKPDQLINRFPRVIFTTKTGLNRILNETADVRTVSAAFYPRCYEINDANTLDRFVDDYKFTACSGVLRWFHEKSVLGQVFESNEVVDVKMPLSLVMAFCVDFCSKKLSHEKEDEKLPFSWQSFFQHYYSLVKKDCIEISSMALHDILHANCKQVLEEIRTSMPQSILDAEKNVWIIKPGHSSQGRGINVRMKLEDILHKEYRKNLVIQKYIEKPLLIYDTKFDIRQWFVVTCWQPLTVWMSKPSYLRFCSQIFTYDSFHESVHLCNNAVQAKYTNAKRSKQLPTENMWTSDEFVSFLNQKGLGDYWESKIYPGMRHAITVAMIASKSKMIQGGARNQSFELFGADFLLSQDFNPWLIEINASPALGHSTAVTAKMVPVFLKDVLSLTTSPGVNKKTVGSLVLIYSELEEDKRKSPEIKKKVDPEQERIIEYIDKVMSVPSCVNPIDSKVLMLKDWMTKSKVSSLKSETRSSTPRPKSSKKKNELKKLEQYLPGTAKASSSSRAESRAGVKKAKSAQGNKLNFFDLGIADLSASHSKSTAVKRITSRIPVVTDERVLYKYKCHHCLA